MKTNANIAISAQKLLLVPYDRRHVPRYHEWMSDPAIQEATASEPLTLEEEYENQGSWRESHDKLTFILCRPPAGAGAAAAPAPVAAGTWDGPDRMVGDINLFLSPWDDEEGEDEGEEGGWCVGEVDVMIASRGDRGKGLGRAAVSTFLHYLWSSRDAVLGEYRPSAPPRLRLLMAKIKATNAHSIALFRGLGFEQEGGVDYFGEVKMVLRDLGRLAGRPDGFEVVEYVRPAS